VAVVAAVVADSVAAVVASAALVVEVLVAVEPQEVVRVFYNPSTFLE
jgi:hypothetical protein